MDISGGKFKPDGPGSLYKDAVKAILTMLGYTDEDFTQDDLVSSRISKFNYLELNADVSRQAADEVNQTDCMNIFYNLLKANKKDSNEIYGKILDCELNSDGRYFNPITILDDARKGPISWYMKNFSVSQSVPLRHRRCKCIFKWRGKYIISCKICPAAGWICSFILQRKIKDYLGLYNYGLGQR